MVRFEGGNKGTIWVALNTIFTRNFTEVADLIADREMTYTKGVEGTLNEGDIVNAGGFRYEVAASGAPDHHLTTAGGVKLKVLPGAGGANVLACGAKGDGVTDDSAAFVIADGIGVGVLVPRTEASYRLVAGVGLSENTVIHSEDGAEIFVDPATTYVGALRVSSGVKVRGLRFHGNGTATSTTGASGSGLAAAIRGENVSHVEVTDCEFDDFVLTGVDHASVGFIGGQNITVSRNRFLSGNEGGTDINLAYTTGGCIVTENHSVSGTDKFCYISSVGSATTIDADSDISSTSHHIISKNIYLKYGGIGGTPSGRHGIAVHYDGGVSHCIITDNILVNGARHGIYLRGAATVGGETGPDIVRGNIIRYFGGGLDESSYWGYNSGIKVETTNRAIIDGNVIEKSGYNPDGTERTTRKAAGIDLIRAGREVMIINNTITDCSGGGIMMAPTVSVASGTYNIDKLIIRNNIIRNNGDVQLNINNRAGSGIRIGRVFVEGNIIEGSEDERFLAAISANNAAAGFELVCRFYNNTLIGAYNGGAGVEQYGLAFGTVGSFELLDVVGNEFHNLLVGASSKDIGTPGDPPVTWPSPTFPAHRQIGEIVRFSRNTFRSCGTSVEYSGPSAGALAFIEPDNVMIDVTTLPDVTYNTGSNKVYYGKVCGVSTAGVSLIELITTTAPTATVQFNAGDKVVFPAPAAGGYSGQVCVTSGTPGTWKGFGLVEA